MTRYAFVLPLVLLALALGGCRDATPDPRLIGPPEQIDLSSCGGDALWSLVGQDVGLLPEGGGWGALRVIWPGMAVTEDYSESRLNVMVNDQGIIESLSCG